MVAEQRETVQRIDADVTDISANVSGAQRELLKYYASISSNRWLMLKIFGVLIIFVSPSWRLETGAAIRARQMSPRCPPSHTHASPFLPAR
jgi:hypothetical protein